MAGKVHTGIKMREIAILIARGCKENSESDGNTSAYSIWILSKFFKHTEYNETAHFTLDMYRMILGFFHVGPERNLMIPSSDRTGLGNGRKCPG